MFEFFTVGVESASNWIFGLVAAVAIASAGIIVGTILGKVVKRVLHEFEVNKVLKAQGMTLPVEEFLSGIIKYAIYLVGIVWALAELGLATMAMEIILAVIFVLLAVFVILAFKDFIPNIMAGFFLHQKGMIKAGDYIRVKSVEGKVLEIDFIETKIKMKNGDTIMVPNSILTKNEVVKFKKSKPVVSDKSQ
ncbi:MAG: mechanosensitive ion channel domain-containing protein [archaeon]